MGTAFWEPDMIWNWDSKKDQYQLEFKLVCAWIVKIFQESRKPIPLVENGSCTPYYFRYLVYKLPIKFPI